MGYREAVEDKIQMKLVNGKPRGYYPPCCMCGEPIFSMNYIRNRKYLCSSCKAYLAKVKKFSWAEDESMQDILKAMCKMEKAKK